MAQLTPLLQQIQVITPNLLEAKALTGISDVINIVQLAEKKFIMIFLLRLCLLKGGHNDDQQNCRDYCYHQLNQLNKAKQDSQYPRDKTKNSHQLSLKQQ